MNEINSRIADLTIRQIFEYKKLVGATREIEWIDDNILCAKEPILPYEMVEDVNQHLKNILILLTE